MVNGGAGGASPLEASPHLLNANGAASLGASKRRLKPSWHHPDGAMADPMADAWCEMAHRNWTPFVVSVDAAGRICLQCLHYDKYLNEVSSV